jgi:23S rRNA pseudouridine1911/1915/1917 synthase
VADHLYGADPTLAARVGLDRQWLHAVKLGFEHPDSGEYVEFESAYPDDLQQSLDVVRGLD